MGINTKELDKARILWEKEMEQEIKEERDMEARQLNKQSFFE